MEEMQVKEIHGNRQAKQSWSICEQSGKRRYRDYESAKLALEEARLERATAKFNGRHSAYAVQRAYPCLPCGGWHLTSREDKFRQLGAA